MHVCWDSCFGNRTKRKALPRMKLISLLVLSLLVGPLAHAQSGNIWYVTPAGSDSNACTQASPCATPDYAFNKKAQPGDTVQVAPGTYNYGNNEIHFTTSGTPGHNVTLTCATRGACKLTNTVTGNSTVIETDGQYQTIDGFEVTNTGGQNNLGFYVTQSFTNITRNTIHNIQTDCGNNGGGGIQLVDPVHDITIDSNLIYDISMSGGVPKCGPSISFTDGIIAESRGDRIVITNNIVHDTSGGWGVLVGPGDGGGNPQGDVVANNLVFNNARGGVVFTTNNVAAINNIVVYNGTQSGADACGFMNSNSSSFTVNYSHNDLFNNGGGNYCKDWNTGTSAILQGDIAVDPASGTTFTNWQENGSGVYTEKEGSPTIGAGTATGAPNHDYAGNPRTAPFDIGAYQVSSDPSAPAPPPPAPAPPSNPGPLTGGYVANTSSANTLTVGQTLQFTAYCTHGTVTEACSPNADALGDKVTAWSTSNRAVLRVSASGLLKAVGAGTANVRARVGSLYLRPWTITVSAN